jgi:hypothetical protein
MELIFELLNVTGSQETAFDLTPWDFNEYFVQGFDVGSETSIPLFASHLYLRCLQSLPTLVRAWFSDCKDRQLTIAVER